jgi:hypothetical protein
VTPSAGSGRISTTPSDRRSTGSRGRDPRHRRTVSGDIDPDGGEAHPRPRRRPLMTALAEGGRWQALPTQGAVRTRASSPSCSSHSLWSSPRPLSWSQAATREVRRARRLQWHTLRRLSGRLRPARGTVMVGTARCTRPLSSCLAGASNASWSSYRRDSRGECAYGVLSLLQCSDSPGSASRAVLRLQSQLSCSRILQRLGRPVARSRCRRLHRVRFRSGFKARPSCASSSPKARWTRGESAP